MSKKTTVRWAIRGHTGRYAHPGRLNWDDKPHAWDVRDDALREMTERGLDVRNGAKLVKVTGEGAVQREAAE